MKRIILASSSPRRSDILSSLNIDFDIFKSDIDEDALSHLEYECSDIVSKLSYEKALFALNKLNNNKEDILIIGADTLVSIDGHILGKPKDKKDALRMLNMLNASYHSVFSGLSVLGYKNGDYFSETLYSESKVFFSRFSENELKDYIDTLEPMDKAGSYGIQGAGSFLLSSIEGDYYSIMGLSANKVYMLIKKYGFLF